MPNMSKIEELRETHCIVSFKMSVEASMECGDLSLPKATVKVFWVLKNDTNIIHCEKLLKELTKQTEWYNTTFEHISEEE